LFAAGQDADMDDDEKRRVMAEHITKFRAWSYDQLAVQIGAAPHFDIVESVASDGTPYFMDVDVFWDDQRNGAVRVVGNFWSDPAGKRFSLLAIHRPDISEGFLIGPDGRFVGEDDAPGN
jgi:hypothetical protein